MKSFTFTILAILISVSSYAQIFLVNSPADVEGTYEFSETVDYGANVLDSIICGDLKMIDPNEGCTPGTNDLTGNIGVVDRGSCNFSLKSYHVQEAGASACIIVNNAPGGGLVNMLGGDSAAAVVIPTIFITYEDGELLKAAMANGTVNACIGNIIFDNDISTDETGVTVPFTGTIPANQIAAPTLAGYSPVVEVRNDGNLDATGVVAECNIDFTPFGGATSNVYNESATESLILADTGFALIPLPDFDYSESAAGVYDVTYSISSNEGDELEANNVHNTKFVVSDNAFAKSDWDLTTGFPERNTGFTVDGGGNIEFFSPFVVNAGEGYSIDSVSFHVSSALDSLAGITVNVYVYEWVDANADGLFDQDEMTIVALANKSWEPNEPAPDNTWVTLGLLEAQDLQDGYAIPEDGGSYIVGTRYEGAETVFFGFNENYDHTVALDNGILTSDMELGYFIATAFLGQQPDWTTISLFTDVVGSTSTSMYVNPIMSSTNNILIDASISLFPNPVSNVLTAEIELAEVADQVLFSITNMNGKLVKTALVENVITHTSTFDVSELPAGQYILTIMTEEGTKTEKFSVNH